MTIVWFVAWLIADLIGDKESVRFDPVNVWAALLVFAIALDVNRPQMIRRGK